MRQSRCCCGRPMSDFLSVETKKPGSLSFPVGYDYREGGLVLAATGNCAQTKEACSEEEEGAWFGDYVCNVSSIFYT